MKKITIMTLTLMAMAFSVSAELWNNPADSLKVVNVCDLTDAALNEIMQGHHPEIAVEFSAQTTLPISFFLKGDLIQLTGNEFGAIEIKQTIYARCIRQELLLSTSLSNWKPFLEFITGNVSVTMSVREGLPSITIGAETNLRS